MKIISSIYYGSSVPAEDCDPRGEFCEDRNLRDGNFVVTEISGHLLRISEFLPRISGHVFVADFSRRFSLDLARFANRWM
ncbi:hypothetical protein A2U01_0045829 [Trifolium medium]|uniref:Uncharacterized protein n=1 Tax=Trifolium medium TaxID=97028 RepID=A0A392QL95_9FABA|nr:hypothetical protein [Trifolium medium]